MLLSGEKVMFIGTMFLSISAGSVEKLRASLGMRYGQALVATLDRLMDKVGELEIATCTT